MIPFYFLCLSVLSGILTSLAFPRLEWSFLVWISLIPLLTTLLQKRTTPNQAWIYGFLAGLVFFLLTLHPLTTVSWWGWKPDNPAGVVFWQRPETFMNMAVLAISIFPGAISWGFFAYFFRLFRSKNILVTAAVVASLWILIAECMRSFFSFSFTWGFLGYTLHDNLYLRQISSLTGMWGLSFLIVWVNIAILYAVIHALPKRLKKDLIISRQSRKVGMYFGVLTALLLLLSFMYGYFQVKNYTNKGLPEIKVAVLQDGSPAPVHVQDYSNIGLDKRYGVMIREAVKKRSGLIILPEAIWFPILKLDKDQGMGKDVTIERQPVENSFQNILKNTNIVLVTGLTTSVQGKHHNSTTYWSRDGLIGLYHKQKLVPFSEYIPWFLTLTPEILPNKKTGFFEAGSENSLVTHGSKQYGSFICQEVLYPEYARGSSNSGADLLITTGNDGVFSDSSVARVNSIAATFRAVENHRWIVRSMKTGYSQIINPLGVIKKQSRLDKREILYDTVYLEDVKTVYTQIGDWFLGFVLILFLTIIALEKRLKTRR